MKIPIKLERDKILAIGLLIAILVGIFIVVSPAAWYFYVPVGEGSLVKAYILGAGFELTVLWFATAAVLMIVSLVSACEDMIKSRRKK